MLSNNEFRFLPIFHDNNKLQLERKSINRAQRNRIVVLWHFCFMHILKGSTIWVCKILRQSSKKPHHHPKSRLKCVFKEHREEKGRIVLFWCENNFRILFLIYYMECRRCNLEDLGAGKNCAAKNLINLTCHFAKLVCLPKINIAISKWKRTLAFLWNNKRLVILKLRGIES